MPAKLINIETRIKVLNSVLETEHHEVLAQALQTANGDWATASIALNGVLSPETIDKLRIADSVATAVGDIPEVTQKILSQPDIKTFRDVAKLNVDELAKRIAPDAAPGSEEHQEARIQAIAINKQSFAHETLTVLQRMTHENELFIDDEKVRVGLGTFLKSIPAETNIRLTPLHKVITAEALKDVPEEQRSAVVDQAKALWRTMAITPADAPQVPPILLKTNRTSAYLVGEMPESTFMQTYSEPMGKETAKQVYANAIDTRIRNEHALMNLREAVRGTGLAAIDGMQTWEERFDDFKSYVLTQDAQLNLDSLFGDMDYCECKDCQSVYSASAYFVELLNFLRNNNLGPDPGTGGPNPNIRSNLKDISDTPLEKLFRRRPDLGNLELSCENTNTALPYIDLVNEVMESYLVHRVDYATNPILEAYNVTDETKDELLAQPQHTKYEAYCILKNAAVYPFTLPFHQPIEAARIFLKYLGTSRHEVLYAFRAAHESLADLQQDPNPFTDNCNGLKLDKRIIDLKKQPGTAPSHGKLDLEGFHNEVLTRACEAEYLGLTQEEYIILTKEAFWPKAYFEFTQNTVFTDEQYQQNIGLKQVYEYYGYTTESALQDTNEDPANGCTGLSFVKKAFLPRTGIQYTDLVELLKTRYINPHYPKGLTLAILENIQFSYRLLQTLVDPDPNITDQKIKYADLVLFLENFQSWDSVPQVSQAFPTEPGVPRENPIIRQWVYCCFEKLGQLIVLESGEGWQLPIEGELDIVQERGGMVRFAYLRKDGTIVNLVNGIIGVVSMKIELDSEGRLVTYAGPVIWTSPEYIHDLYLIDKEGCRIGILDKDGLFTFGCEQG